MKKYLLIVYMCFTLGSTTTAQQFISITPDFGNSGQTISTVITSSGFNFTTGTVPTTWGDLYMMQGSSQIFPSSVSVIDDDNLAVDWPIPLAAPTGYYDVVWYFPFNFTVPGGFNVNCIAPPAQVTAGPSVCYGDSLFFQANTGPGYQYQWYRYGVLIPGATNSTLYYPIGGEFTVRVADATGCGRISDPVYSGFLPSPNANVFPVSNIICPGSSVLLYADSGPSYTYQWYENGALIPGATSINYLATDSGAYSVRVTNSLGCSLLSSQRLVSFYPSPQAGVTPSGPLSFCNGGNVTLTTIGGTGYTYQWYKYGNAIPGATQQSLLVSTAGTYKVKVTNSFGCTKKSGAKIVTVIPKPSATITPSGNTFICPGDSVVLQANNGTGYTYYWKKYGNVIPGATSSSYTAKTTGIYKVVVTNASGCSKVSSPLSVTVIVCRENMEETTDEINIYPNPATRNLFVKGEGIDRVEIINVEGRIVLETPAPENGEIDISSLPDGIYLTRIYRRDEILTRKFMKQL